MAINDAILLFSRSPFDPEVNFWVAQEYENMGQTAAAISFYLRTAEYGYETHKLLAYNSLLRMANCFELQNNRELTVSGVLFQALALIPERPEAYFLMSKFYEKTNQWQEVYTWAVLGKDKEKNGKPSKLPRSVGYIFDSGFNFQIAASSFWIGRRDRSVSMFIDLEEDFSIIDKYSPGVKNNLERLLG